MDCLHILFSRRFHAIRRIFRHTGQSKLLHVLKCDTNLWHSMHSGVVQLLPSRHVFMCRITSLISWQLEYLQVDVWPWLRSEESAVTTMPFSSVVMAASVVAASAVALPAFVSSFCWPSFVSSFGWSSFRPWTHNRAWIIIKSVDCMMRIFSFDVRAHAILQPQQNVEHTFTHNKQTHNSESIRVQWTIFFFFVFGAPVSQRTSIELICSQLPSTVFVWNTKPCMMCDVWRLRGFGAVQHNKSSCKNEAKWKEKKNHKNNYIKLHIHIIVYSTNCRNGTNKQKKLTQMLRSLTLYTHGRVSSMTLTRLSALSLH